MPRNNADFRGQALYHGSPAAFSVGDVIHPGDEGVAFATPSLEEAHHYGSFKAYNQTGSWNHSVYQVEPLGRVTTKYADSDSPYYGGSKGLRVIGKVEDGS